MLVRSLTATISMSVLPSGALHIDRTEEVPAHPAETVDANSDCHE